MDPNSACRVIVKVPAYVELPYQEYHVTENLKFVVDKDTTNWMDFLADLKLKIKHGKEQVLHVSFMDKNSQKYVEIASDNGLINAFSQYWDIRRLTLEAIVYDPDEIENAIILCTSLAEGTSSNQEQCNVTPTPIVEEDDVEEHVDELQLLGPNYEPEYVGVDDEAIYLDDNVAKGVANQSSIEPHIDVAIVPNVVVGNDEDDREEDTDDADWEGTEDDNVIIPVVVHDNENPVMKVGTTFSNIHEFRLAICQYAIKKEFEFNIDKSEPRRFRAHCAAEGCRWYIYARPMMDKTTFQVLHIFIFHFMCKHRIDMSFPFLL
jgi:hypothetical protein